MWTTAHTATTDASPAAVWAAIRALHSGEVLGLAGDRFELHGPFAVGTRLSVTPNGQDTIQSVITELEPERTYADVTRFGEMTLTFRHTLAPDGRGTAVTHTLEIEGPDGVAAELGPAISADFPAAMAELLEAAGRATP